MSRLSIPPRALGWIVLVVAVCYALGVQTYTVFHVSQDEHVLALVVQQDHSAIAKHGALLKELRADEAKYCTAAKASGDSAIAAIVCGAGGTK